MAALEQASARQDIAPFTDFLAGLVEERLKGKTTAEVPAEHNAGSNKFSQTDGPERQDRERRDQ